MSQSNCAVLESWNLQHSRKGPPMQCLDLYWAAQPSVNSCIFSTVTLRSSVRYFAMSDCAWCTESKSCTGSSLITNTCSLITTDSSAVLSFPSPSMVPQMTSLFQMPHTQSASTWLTHSVSFPLWGLFLFFFFLSPFSHWFCIIFTLHCDGCRLQTWNSCPQLDLSQSHMFHWT